MISLLRRHAYTARGWALFAVLPAIVVGVGAYFYSAREQKVYQTSTTLFVQTPGTSGVGAGFDPTSSSQLAQSYAQLVTAGPVFAATNIAMGKKYPGYDVGAHLAGTSNPTASGGQELTISVQDTVPARAAAGATALSKAFIAYIAKLQGIQFAQDQLALQNQIAAALTHVQSLQAQVARYKGSTAGLIGLQAQLSTAETAYQSDQTSLDALRAAKDSSSAGIITVNAAPIPGAPISPQPKRDALIFAFLALVVCGGAIYVYERFDESLKSPEEVLEVAGAPILGTIPAFHSDDPQGQLITATTPRSPISEAYRVLRTNLQFTDVDRPSRAILVTSPMAREGKSTTVSNLAQVLAEGGSRVIIVDTDLRRPSLHRIFGLGRETGLTSALTAEHLNGKGISDTAEPNLALVSSGPLPPSPADVLNSDRMRSILSLFREGRDMVLLDSPPILSVTDASVLASLADGVVLVVDLAKTKRRDLERARDAIQAVGGKLLGVVINRLSPKTSGQYYYYYSHYYNYSYPSQPAGDGPPAGDAPQAKPKSRNPIAKALARR